MEKLIENLMKIAELNRGLVIKIPSEIDKDKYSLCAIDIYLNRLINQVFDPTLPGMD